MVHLSWSLNGRYPDWLFLSLALECLTHILPAGLDVSSLTWKWHSSTGFCIGCFPDPICNKLAMVHFPDPKPLAIALFQKTQSVSRLIGLSNRSYLVSCTSGHLLTVQQFYRRGIRWGTDCWCYTQGGMSTHSVLSFQSYSINDNWSCCCSCIAK